MRTVINYYPLDTRVSTTVAGKDVKIAVRIFDSTKGTSQCAQCCFGEAIIDEYMSGQRLVSGYCCGLTVTGETNCSNRADMNRVVYKMIVKK